MNMINTENSDIENTASPAQDALIGSAGGSPERTPPPAWSRERLDRLPYGRGNERGPSRYGVTMPGGYWVDEDLVRTAWRLFWRGVHGLDPARSHPAEGLYGHEAWDRHHRRDRLKLGRCFKYFAVNQVLPITLANPDKKGKRKYRLDADLVSAPTLH